MKAREREKSLVSAVLMLITAVNELSEKVDSCNGFCECILDEVTPMGAALDKLANAPEVE